MINILLLKEHLMTINVMNGVMLLDMEILVTNLLIAFLLKEKQLINLKKFHQSLALSVSEPNKEKDNNSNKLSPGSIAEIVIGCIDAVVIIVLVVFFVLKKRKKDGNNSEGDLEKNL